MENIELTNDEKARIYAMYWGSEVEYDRRTATNDKERTIVNISIDFSPSLLIQRNPQLLLNPLSSITDEDCLIIAQQVNRIFNDAIINTPFGNQAISFGYNQAKNAYNSSIWQYLISKGYAVPLFFSPNHPANGKNAIELGIAIDKTKN